MMKLLIFMLAVAGAFIVLGGLAAIEEGLSRWVVSIKKNRLNKLLNGQSLEDVLSKSPYKYGHSQGDSLYRGWDERKGPEILHWFSSPLDAQLWVVETYLSEQNKQGD